MDYAVTKALHIIGFVSWFAALFYIPRLFIYDVEAEQREPAARVAIQEQLRMMQRRLWYAIAWPAMIFTVVFGLWTAVPYFLSDVPIGWLHVKLTLILALVIYHLMCGKIRKQLAAGTSRWTSSGLRVWNEVATLLLVAIVFLAVMKNTFDMVKGMVGLFLFAVALMIAIRVYRKARLARAASMQTP
ncbi:CopD family protein [Haliangium ochraceum]|uniref:Protoporphyrinogen IX oxidase n=1 Tax=Haliangium ochraceum (strain DSM 14365 / JCM 11303 / SMP-2) TaxID=502025 RepID=D0LIZ6_HALO1|nr:CopD family protein [Haliangium ochraceum]ACY13025.1 conserved hypothetical protein [Haliangium ochraceum DSM 14365]